MRIYDLLNGSAEYETRRKNNCNMSKQESRPNDHPVSSVPLPPERPSLEVEIDQFIQGVADGAKRWVDAGQLLIRMLRRDKNVFHKLIARCEWLSIDILMTFVRIGRMELRPEIFLMNPQTQSKVLKLGYSQQSKLLDSRVQVVVDIKPNGEPMTQQKKASELSGADLGLLIDGAKIRTVNEQLNVLRSKRNKAVVTTVAPLLKSDIAPERKVMFLGNYRIVMRFGKPELVKCTDLAPGAQRVLLTKDMGGEMAALLELTKWSDA